ncbi:MAG: AAA domain-containing protein, partial [Caldilineaceae bacterium SB0665_bin_25]|nr:AAA domain-containing protein [Caldilineaceae bacterium SB0665_bin_25]
NELIKPGNLDKWENNYKRDLARDLEKAREELFADTDKWVSLVDRGLKSNLIYFTNRLNFREWMIHSRDAARKALMAIWAKESLSVDQRIRNFCKDFPREVIGGGAGTRLNLASVLLMGVDVESFPPFRIRVFQKVCRRTEYGLPEKGADEGTLYVHFLGFLNQLIDESGPKGVELPCLLDAQGVVWQLQNHLPKLGVQPVEPKSLNALADELLLTPDFLEEISSLLDDKRQVIFQGPPGTGKTYLAQELAKFLADSESGERITPVQFHPSYSYEDFVRGFRPTLREGQAGFKLQDGPLLRAAGKARDEPGSKHFLIIDEINRGNLSKLFGELYFLLEYRDEPIHMQYQEDDEEDFSLPENLYIIGTMNTADRSIALVDLALRRRFHFVEFHPDSEPVKSLLRRWLERQGLQETLGIVKVIKKANELLQDDRHAAIGPSYFMKEDLDRKMVERIWKHSVIPYIEERLFGDEDFIREFEFKKLCSDVAPELLTSKDEGQTGDVA